MAYDLTTYMTQNLAKNGNQAINIGVVDSLHLGRAYPYFKGFQQAMQVSGLQWNEVASVNASTTQDVDEVKTMLRQYPRINVLWGATNIATENALRAVQELNLSDRIKIYGVLDLTAEKAEWLLDSHNPLQSIVDEAPQQVGETATAAAIAILKGTITAYQYHRIQHRLLGQTDQDQVKVLLKSELQRFDSKK